MKNIMRIAIVAATCAAGCLSAQAQEAKSGSRWAADRVTSLSVSVRGSTLVGSADSDLDADYGDLFGSGIGFGIEGDVLWKVQQDRWRVGMFLSVDFDRYGGGDHTDELGDTLETDGVDITTILVGFKARNRFGDGFHFGMHAGMGVATWSDVEGTLTVNSLGPPPFLVDVDVFESTTTFAFDLGAQVGYGSGPFFAEVGVGLRTQGAPNDADFDLDSSAAIVPSIEFGAGFRF